MTVVLGIDPNFHQTGWVLAYSASDRQIWRWGLWLTTMGRKGLAAQHEQTQHLKSWLVNNTVHEPLIVAIEDTHLDENPNTFKLLSELCGGMAYVAFNHGVSVVRVSSSEVRSQMQLPIKAGRTDRKLASLRWASIIFGAEGHRREADLFSEAADALIAPRGNEAKADAVLKPSSLSIDVADALQIALIVAGRAKIADRAEGAIQV